MLNRKYRFHSRGGVKYTYRNGKVFRTKDLTLVCAKNVRKHQRFAVVVSKKVLKTAVGRNRIRRRIYEAIRLELPKCTANIDCIFVVNNREIRDIDFAILRKIVQDLLKQGSMI